MRERSAMLGMSRGTTERGPEHLLMAHPRRDSAFTVVVVALTALLLAAVANPSAMAHIQRLDDAWLELMASNRTAALTALALVLNVLGLVWVTLPIRIGIAGFLALSRRWWHLAAFVATVVMSEILIGTLKDLYDRTRAPGSLVETSGASFPSGHAIAASATVVAAVIALVPPGRRRAAWGAGAVVFSLLMALSRAYLGAHWLSDAVAGVFLGTSCALVACLGVGAIQSWSERRTAAQDGSGASSVALPKERL